MERGADRKLLASIATVVLVMVMIAGIGRGCTGAGDGHGTQEKNLYLLESGSEFGML